MAGRRVAIALTGPAVERLNLISRPEGLIIKERNASLTISSMCVALWEAGAAVRTHTSVTAVCMSMALTPATDGDLIHSVVAMAERNCGILSMVLAVKLDSNMCGSNKLLQGGAVVEVVVARA